MVYLRQTQILQLDFTGPDPINYSLKCEFTPDYLVVKQLMFCDDVKAPADPYDVFCIQTDIVDTKCGKIAVFGCKAESYPNIYFPVSQPINGSYSFKLGCTRPEYSMKGKVILVLEFNKWAEHTKYSRR